MSQKSEKAVELFQTYNCAQAVLVACGSAEGLDQRTCLMVASAFGGGMARHGATCGAVTGALMTIGYRECKNGAGDLAALKASINNTAGSFIDEFKRRYGSTDCRDLTGCDLQTPEGQQQFKQRQLHHELCEKLVAGAVEMLEQK